MRYFVNKLLTLYDYKRGCFQPLKDAKKRTNLISFRSIFGVNRTVDRCYV